jgi:hypothetical protein
MLLFACTYPYTPELEGSRGTLAINGKVTDQGGYQYIEISRTVAPQDEEKAMPETGYAIEVQDDEGNIFPGTEMEPGKYACWMDQAYLAPGKSYRLMVTDDRGRVYLSEFDKMLPCPEIDSITYEIREQPTENPDQNYKGIQFYVHTDGSGDYARNFRWELEETWEYHSSYEIFAYYDGQIRLLPTDSYDYFYCWESRRIPYIYTYSTQHLTSGRIRNYPLHFVSDLSDRLSYKYSTLVKQYSLSPEAFEFWNILENQSKQTGELYETQPARLQGNIHAQDPEGETVLGFFSASAVRERRIFVSMPLPVNLPDCSPYGLSSAELMELLADTHPNRYPVYLVFVDLFVYDFADQECFDCRLRGGSTERPDFWE